ncbi:hypothetical protein [Xenorhabdus bovienii]|uniref:Lipoprotein n=1 Tax=Xenorhabdus bovienii str. feltiae Moldova TaxID=1398200 RepID=A0A077NW25_XENBV|nr:hypothetical protein [Xenorhabdus bovienii]CDH02578.1 exported hypothetical protein [Xenorhabdus bovienii str. feltiae Moldova]
MKKLIVGMVAVLALSGCASQFKEKEPLPKVTVENQRCSSNSECNAMWGNVPEKLELITRMRVDTVSNIYISTYSPSGNRFLGGSVKLVPVSNTEKEIKSSFNCLRYMDDYSCQKLTILATNAFNEGMKGAKRSYSSHNK